MGFDVYGIKPIENTVKPEILKKDWYKLEKQGEKDKYFEAQKDWENKNPGQYFRNNVWWWRPLWDYVCEVCEDVMTEEEMEAGGSNSGFSIPWLTAVDMVEKLQKEIATKNHKKYETNHTKKLKDLPDEKCEYCKGTGIRSDLPTKENNYVVKSGCNVCKGKGTNRPFQTNYPFSAKNVEEFTDFLSQSGGIQIC